MRETAVTVGSSHRSLRRVAVELIPRLGTTAPPPPGRQAYAASFVRSVSTMPRPLSITSALADAVSSDLLLSSAPSPTQVASTNLRRANSEVLLPHHTSVDGPSTSASTRTEPEPWQTTEAQLQLVFSDEDDSSSSSDDSEFHVQPEVCELQLLFNLIRHGADATPGRVPWAVQTTQLVAQHRLWQVQCACCLLILLAPASY